MRGKGERIWKPLEREGITPAYAGKSQQSGSGYNDRRDHPRLCGEKVECSPIAPIAEGSPPPMRGKENEYALNYSTSRITPAYAGKSAAAVRCSPQWSDHPRLCGEKYIRMEDN